MDFLFSSYDIQLKKLRRKQLIWDTIAGFLGSSTLIFALVEGYYYFYEAKTIVYFDDVPPGEPTYEVAMGANEESPKLFYLRIYITIASVFLALSIIVRYLYEKKIRIATLKAEGLWTPKYRFSYWLMSIEVLYALLFLPPHVNGVYQEQQTGVYVTTDMLITTLMTGRLYLTLRALYKYSMFSSQQAQTSCRELNAKPTAWFVFKSELKHKPFILVGLLLCLLFLFLGFGVRQTEVPYKYTENGQWEFVFNGVWCIFLTVTTVGYGDVAPRTSLGRLFCIVAAMLGSFFTSLFVIAISDYFSMELKERNAVYTIKRKVDLSEHKLEAKQFIAWTWRYSFFVRQLRIISKKRTNHIYHKMCTSYLQFKESRRKLKLDSDFAISAIDRSYYGVSDALKRNAMKTQMIMWDVRIFEAKLSLLEKRQDQIEKMTDVIHTMYHRIENVTRPFAAAVATGLAKDRKSQMNISFGDFSSLLKIDNMDYVKEFQKISAELPYERLSSSIENAFRFRNQEFGLISRAKERDRVPDQRKKTRLLSRLEKARENVGSTAEKEEALRSGGILKSLESVFGKSKAQAIYSEMKKTDSKRFGKVATGLANLLHALSNNPTSMNGEEEDDESNSSESVQSTPKKEYDPFVKQARDNGIPSIKNNPMRQKKFD